MTNTIPADLITALRQARDDAAEAEIVLSWMVLQAREEGATYADIARVLGVTRQAVQQRYSV